MKAQFWAAVDVKIFYLWHALKWSCGFRNYIGSSLKKNLTILKCFMYVNTALLLNVMKVMLRPLKLKNDLTDEDWTYKTWDIQCTGDLTDIMKRLWTERAGICLCVCACLFVLWGCTNLVVEIADQEHSAGSRMPRQRHPPCCCRRCRCCTQGADGPYRERGAQRKDHVSPHSPEEPTAQQLRWICPVAMHSTCLHPPHQAHPVTQPTPHTSGKPTSQSQYLPLGRSLSEPISHRLAL